MRISNRMLTRPNWIIPVAAVVSCFVGAALWAEEVSLRSVYLAEALDDAHRIEITGQLGGRGRLLRDQNTCGLNLFGDTELCTQVGFPPIIVQIKRLDTPDPREQKRQLYEIVGGHLPEGHRYYLVIPSEGHAYRLVADRGERGRRIIPLEPFVPDAR